MGKDILNYLTQNSSKNLTPTPTPSPTPLPNITPTITPNASQSILEVKLCPHGYGNCGDNVTSSAIGNTNPTHSIRNVMVTIFDTTHNQVGTPQPGQVSYIASAKNFQGTILLSHIPNGSYFITIKMDGFLGKQIPQLETITQGKSLTVPEVSLVNGDINNDNQLDILDYNSLISCYANAQTNAKYNCQIPRTAFSPGADILDDGSVDGADYNEFIREISVQPGS